MDALEGTMLGDRFALVDPIAREGLVHVWRARDALREAYAAIHIVAAPWAADEHGRRELARSAMAASSLRNARLVDALAAGALPDGRPWVATELLEARTLRDILRDRGALDCASVVAIVADLAVALDALHGIELVHHRLTPAKVFVTADRAGEPLCRLVGVGVGEMVRDIVRGRRITLDTNVYHHAPYLAPEACDADEGDRRADVYALAAIAFELLAGRPPFAGETPLATMAAKLAGPAPFLAAVAGRPFHPAIEAVLCRGLARQASQRYASAGSFASDLVLALHTAARSPTSGVDLDPYRLRLRIAAGLPRPEVSRIIRITPGAGASVPPAIRQETAVAAPPARPPRARRWGGQLSMLPALLLLAGTAAAIPAIAPFSPGPTPAAADATFDLAPDLEHAVDEALDPRDAAVEELLRRGDDQLLRGFEAEAQVLFREALSREPESPRAWRGLAVSLDLSGEPSHRTEAARAYRRYLAYADRPRDGAQIRRRIDILRSQRSRAIKRPARAQAPRREPERSGR